VDQMLTGFDSKWLNTLYMDKVLKYENIIQAFSRTNRLFGPDKPFGTIRYYRKPHTMEQNIFKAVKLYSGDKPLGLFVEQLDYNLTKMNSVFGDISHLFNQAGIQNFEKLPTNLPERGKFAKLFKEMNDYLEAAKIQGFKWSLSHYEFSKGNQKKVIEMNFDENAFLILALRYKELFSGGGDGGGSDSVPFEIDGYLTEIDTGVIDADYMNSRFEKYLKTLKNENTDALKLQQTLDELHKSFASLTQEEQKYANMFIHDVQSGNANLVSGKTFREYITEYQFNTKNKEIYSISQLLGLDETKLRNMMASGVSEPNINEYGRFDELKDTVDKEKARQYFEKLENSTIPPFKINIRIHNLLKDFIISNGFEVEGTD
jgi:type I restriction enzyme R subunit